jgi:nucleoside-triphosphatase THEP1
MKSRKKKETAVELGVTEHRPPAHAGITIISGPRDSGKTRDAARRAQELRAQGFRVGGVLSEAEVRGSVKVLYAFRDLGGGGRKVYAQRKPDPIPPGGPAYDFLEEGLAFARSALRRACAEGVDAIVVDEVGPLEMRGDGLWEPLQEVIAAHRGRLIITVRPSLLDPLLARLAPSLAGAPEIVKL